MLTLVVTNLKNTVVSKLVGTKQRISSGKLQFNQIITDKQLIN